MTTSLSSGHGDAASEAFLSEIVGAAPWPGLRHWNMESIYEYGARAGIWRLHRMFTGANVPVTVYGVASALARSPDQVEAMQSAGWEIRFRAAAPDESGRRGWGAPTAATVVLGVNGGSGLCVNDTFSGRCW